MWRRQGFLGKNSSGNTTITQNCPPPWWTVRSWAGGEGAKNYLVFNGNPRRLNRKTIRSIFPTRCGVSRFSDDDDARKRGYLEFFVVHLDFISICRIVRAIYDRRTICRPDHFQHTIIIHVYVNLPSTYSHIRNAGNISSELRYLFRMLGLQVIGRRHP